MSWLLFLDESGHDHKKMPYEVHGGFAIHATKLWPFIQTVQQLEKSIFGTDLRDHDRETKGHKLLNPRRFEWAAQDGPIDATTRCKFALNFLNNGKEKRQSRREEFTAYGQACLAMANQVLELLYGYDARIFASAIPCEVKPSELLPRNYLRKDFVFLLERYFYFLEEKQETGLLVMDGTEKTADGRFVRQMERYFIQTQIGRQRTQWVVPTPFFVESDMAYGIQVADLCIYCLNWGWRLRDMVKPTRKEIEPFCGLMKKSVWQGDGYRGGKVFRTSGIVYVADPYSVRPGFGEAGA